MNKGEWESARDLLQSIPRSSPFAPLRMLCRAMCAFYAGEDQEMIKALSMIPEDFILSPFARTLHVHITDPGKLPERSTAALQPLFTRPLDIASGIRALSANFKKGDRQVVARRIRTLAESIYPEDPDACVFEIVQIMSNRMRERGFSLKFFVELAKTLLPREKSFNLVLRLDVLGDYPLDAAARYIENISHDFPDPRRQPIAKSIVLFEALRQSLQKKSFFDEFNRKAVDGFADFDYGDGPFAPKPSDTPWHLLGIRSENEEMALLGMAREGIVCDPGNREWYERIIALPHLGSEEKKIVKEAMLTMAEHFPEDPFPYLELAMLYQGKSAFRKAEKALEAAAARAPYDNRVMEKKAVFYLISASINIYRDKLHLAVGDLEKAGSMNNRRAIPYIIEKRILLEFLGNREAGEKRLSEALSDLSPFERLRLLSLLILDLTSGKASRPVSDADVKSIRKRLDDEVKAVSGINSAEVIRLLSLVGHDFRPAMPPHEPKILAEVFSKRQIRKLLPLVDDSDIIAAGDRILPTGWHDLIHKELAGRLKNRKPAQYPLMFFYHAVLGDLTGKKTDFEFLEKLVGSADPEMCAKLEAAATRLAPYASGLMKKALMYFDFDFTPWDDDDDDEWDEDLIGEIVPVNSGRSSGKDAKSPSKPSPVGFFDNMSPEEIIDYLEGIIDRMKWRGSPDYLLRSLRKMVKSTIRPETAQIKEILDFLPDDFVERLSREARIVFIE